LKSTLTPAQNLDQVSIQIGEQAAEIPSTLPMREWLFAWLVDTKRPGNLQKEVDLWIGILIVANLLALLLEHLPVVYEPYKTWFHFFDMVSVGIFSIEYLLRLYLAPEDPEFKNAKHARLRYMRSPFAIIDLLAVAPFYLQAFIPVDLRVLRFLRLLRILKLFRVLIPAWHEFMQMNKQRSFRQKIHALVFPSDYGGRLHNLFDSFIMVWVVISVIGVVLESVQSVSHVMNLEFIIMDAVAVAIFSIEYCLRMYACVENPAYKKAVTGRLKHAKTPSMIVDFLAILPFFLEIFLHHLMDLRFLRVFRLMRLLKLTRYTGATATLSKVIAREWPVLSASAFVMLLLVVLTASLGYLFEHDAQPDKFENIPQSIYWAVITLASVGYGDISPVTTMGRFMTIILALMGIGIFAIPAALLSSAFTDQLRIERENLRNQLFDMLADGVISPEEAEVINLEAKRLHLTQEDVDQLVEKARRERVLMDDVSALPIHKIASNSEHAVEHFKTLISQIRQLGIMTDRVQFEAVAGQSDRLTRHELALWEHIHQGSAAATPTTDS
jgi:voltage-gated potassium channel